MPASAGPFEQQGFHAYDDTALGYTWRYVDDAGRRWFDIYIYPVPQDMQSRSHEERVAILTQWARRDIDSAVTAGHYLSQTDLGVEGYAAGDRLLAKSRHRIVTANGELYSIIYLTEAADSVVKVRVSVPGTALNVVSEDFEEHVLAVVEQVVAALDAR